jgi:hypothetical protein
MTQIADKKGDQTQHGPGFCCSVQLSDNPQKDKEKIRINSTLFQFPSDPQTDLILLSCHTDNPTGCDGKATATVNGASATFTCEGNASPCDGGVACDSASSETGACVPVPCTVGGEGGCPEIPPPPTTTITLLAAPPR